MQRANQSNPISTGGGGVSFEISVLSYFAIQMIAKDRIPYLGNSPVSRIILQGKYEGFNTDDCVILCGDDSKLLCQIKRGITISAHDSVFRDVIVDAWNDYSNNSHFNSSKDRIFLIVAELSDTDIHNTLPIFDWALHSDSSEEFVKKLNTEGFVSKEKRNKYQAIKEQLETAKGEGVSEAEIFGFLKCFRVMSIDVDRIDSPLAIEINSKLAKLSKKENASDALYRIVAEYNKNAGTLTREVLLHRLEIDENEIDRLVAKKVENHNKLIQATMKNEIEGISFERHSYIEQVEKALVSYNMVMVSGGRGVGKTGVVKAFLDVHGENAYKVFFRADEFNKASIAGVFSELNWDFDLSQLNQVGLGYKEHYIIIESLERLLENEYRTAFIDLLTFVVENPNWKIIASVRDYACQLIMFEFLMRPSFAFETVFVDKIEEEQLTSFLKQQNDEVLLRINSETFELLRIPIYLEYVIKAMKLGYIITSEDTQQSISRAIWECVVEKASERKNGLPQKRADVFESIAVQRAKQLKYEVSLASYDYEIIQKLEEDGLIVIRNDVVAIRQDVLEDWALERWLDRKYIECKGNLRDFYTQIGYEQSICRAYRLWLSYKATDSFLLDVSEFVLAESENIDYSVWADETIVAILNSDRLMHILSSMGDQIIAQPKLVERFCFILRVAAKRPDNRYKDWSESDRLTEQSSFIILKPEGKCWVEFITFLCDKKDAISIDLYPHCTELMSEWIKVLTIGQDTVAGKREAGLLALHLIKALLEKKTSETDQLKKLYEVVLNCFSSVSKEFEEFLDKTLFSEEYRKKHYEISDLSKSMLTDFSCCHIAKNNPRLLLRVARQEWFLSERSTKMFWTYGYVPAEEEYGLCSNSEFDYSRASAYREPFHSLFRWSPGVAVDFVIELCNSAAQNFMNYQIEGKSEEERNIFLEELRISIKNRNDIVIRQYATESFWCAYRGMGTVPGVIVSSLMALEEYLLSVFHNSDSEKIEGLLDYLVSKSNSVMVTAVVAAVLIANKDYVGKSSLLLFQNSDLFAFDLHRVVYESSLVWFGIPYSTKDRIFFNERKKSNAYEWRKNSLVDLCFRLQFTKLRESIFEQIDSINDNSLEDVTWQFCRKKIDSREYILEKSDNGNELVFVSGPVEGELKKIQDDQEVSNEWISKYGKWLRWSEQYVGEKEHIELPSSVDETICELKKLINHYQETHEEILEIYRAGINRAIAALLEGYTCELREEDLAWCIDYTRIQLEEYDNRQSCINYRATDFCDIHTLALTWMHLIDYVPFEIYWKLAICMFTSFDFQLRMVVAKRIAQELWETHRDIALRCIAVVCQFDQYEQEFYAASGTLLYDKSDEMKRIEWLCHSRNLLLEVCEFSHAELSLNGASVLLVLLPKSASIFENIQLLFEKCVDRICSVENRVKRGNYHEDADERCFHMLCIENAYSIGDMLYNLTDDQFNSEIEIIEKVAQQAPSTCKWMMHQYKLLCEKNKRYSSYWRLWNSLRAEIKQIVMKLNQNENYSQREERELVSEYMYVHHSWQPLDYENKPVDSGADYICSFVKEIYQNAIVYEGLASLMYHFPDSFLVKGIRAHADISEEELVALFHKSTNSLFYMENNIYAFITNTRTNKLPEKEYVSCNKILTALIKCASAKAYCTREYLLKSIRM